MAGLWRVWGYRCAMTFNELAAWVDSCAPQLRGDLREMPIVFQREGDVQVIGASCDGENLVLYH